MSHRARVTLLCLAVVWLASSHGTRAQTTPLNGIHVGAHVYFPDGRAVSMWHPLGATTLSATDSFELGAVRTLCIFQSGADSRSNTDGWQVQVTPLRDVELPGGAVELSLRPGESVPLDYIPAGPVPAGERCNAVGMLLRAEVWPRRGAGGG